MRASLCVCVCAGVLVYSLQFNTNVDEISQIAAPRRYPFALLHLILSTQMLTNSSL